MGKLVNLHLITSQSLLVMASTPHEDNCSVKDVLVWTDMYPSDPRVNARS